MLIEFFNSIYFGVFRNYFILCLNIGEYFMMCINIFFLLELLSFFWFVINVLGFFRDELNNS